MEVKVAGLFLALCAHAVAAPKCDPNFSLIGNSAVSVATYCSHISPTVLFFSMTKPQKENIAFQLRTRCRNTQYPVEEAIKLRNAPEFDVNKKTVVYVSGWQTTMADLNTEKLSDALFCRNDSNIIVVNTNNYLRTEYIKAAFNTEKIGEFVALGLKNLNIPATDIHLMGHSLGAHVMGSAARHYATITGKKIARVTGLDPARPCFIGTAAFSRLFKTDANFVDIVHSNVCQAGIEEAIGHADFYVNGLQPSQPGCFITPTSCAHSRSMKYFAESVYPGNEKNFMATRCDDYKQLEDSKCVGPEAPMGYAANEKNKGIYDLDVNAIPPYGKNFKSHEYLKPYKCHVCPN